MKIYNSKYKIITLLFCVFGFYSQISAQISSGGEPVSFTNASLSKVGELPFVETPSFDKTRMLQEDNSNTDIDRPVRIAKAFKVDYDFLKLAQLETLSNGDKIYRLGVKSKDAIAVNVNFSKFVLPRGAKLYIYSEDKSHVIGAFTSNNNKKSLNLPTGFVRGESIIVEYFEPANTIEKGMLNIDCIGHDYHDIHGFFSAQSQPNYYGWYNRSWPCNIDVNCTEGANSQDTKRAVAGISYINYATLEYYICSGSLVNNTMEDQTPYFLTANHCISSQPSAASALFYFNYERNECDGMEGTLAQCVAVSELRANHPNSDFCLLELSEKPPSNYNPYYAGWDRSDVAATSSTGIHHPMGDVKKISIENDPATSNIQFAWFDDDGVQTSPTYPNDSHWRVVFDEGTSEGGSSGSPLFDQNNRIVGQLNGGQAGCSVGNPFKVYGKFHTSWTGGDTESTRLQDWLDPKGSGATFLDGLDVLPCPNDMDITTTYLSGASANEVVKDSITANNLIEEDTRITYDAGRFICLNPGFQAVNNSVFTGKIEGCTGHFLEEFPFYEDLIYTDNCCDDIMVLHQFVDNSGIDTDLHYVYIENGPNCSPFSALYVNEIYWGPDLIFDLSLADVHHYSNLEPGCEVDIFEVYPWISDYLDPAVCCPGTRVSSYTSSSYDAVSGRVGGFDFLYIEYGPSCGNKTELRYVSNGYLECESPANCLDQSINWNWPFWFDQWWPGLGADDQYPGYVLYEAGSCKTSNSSDLLAQSDEFETSVNIYPNPAKNSTTVDFYLDKESNVTISLFDIQGKEVNQVVNNQVYPEGQQQLNIDCSDVLAGTYFCTIKVDDEVHNRKLIILE